MPDCRSLKSTRRASLAKKMNAGLASLFHFVDSDETQPLFMSKYAASVIEKGIILVSPEQGHCLNG